MGWLNTLTFHSLFHLCVNAYSFNIVTTPKQCSALNVTITGSGGTPPYRLSIIPFGGTPLQDSLEVRRVLDVPFNDSSSVSITLAYPTNSQFVAVVSDHNGTGSNYGSGGATVPVNVVSGGPDSCLPTAQVHPAFTFSSDPVGSLTTCQTGALTWDSSAQGQVTFWATIPGGDNFVIPNSGTFQDKGSSAINWTPQIRTGVNVVVVAGDNRGFGSGGSFQVAMQPGNGTTSCIDGSSPVSTAGPPAGGSYPTNASGGTTGGGGSSSPNIGAIVGGVIGGVAAIAIIGIAVFFLARRARKNRERQRFEEKPVDLLDGRDGTNADPSIPNQYIPEPFQIPRSSREGLSEASQDTPATLFSRDRRQSNLSVTMQTRLSSEHSSGMPLSSATRKSAAGPTALRPVNIVQHEDAGPSEQVSTQEPETVELPPAYTNLQKPKGQDTTA